MLAIDCNEGPFHISNSSRVLISGFGDSLELITNSAGPLAHGFHSLAVVSLGVVRTDFGWWCVGTRLLWAVDWPIRRTRTFAFVIYVTRTRATRLKVRKEKCLADRFQAFWAGRKWCYIFGTRPSHAHELCLDIDFVGLSIRCAVFFLFHSHGK